MYRNIIPCLCGLFHYFSQDQLERRYELSKVGEGATGVRGMELLSHGARGVSVSSYSRDSGLLLL